MVLCVAPGCDPRGTPEPKVPSARTALYRTVPIAPLRERFPDLGLVERGRNDLPAITWLKAASMFDLGLTTGTT